MVNALAVLLFSSLTCVGVLAIWAATSSQHWFWRTMLFLGVISLLLLIPAYEPFVAFVIQGAVVATGVQLVRWRRSRKLEAEYPGARFDLRTILLAMVPVAVLTAVAVQLPSLNFRAWQSIVLIGICSGVATLVGLWIVHGTSPQWLWRTLIGMFTGGVLSLMLVWRDWFVASVYFWQWPPPMEDGETNPAIGFFEYRIVTEHHQTIWILTVCAVTGCIAVVISILASLSHSNRYLNRRPAMFMSQLLSYACLFLIGLFLVVPPASIYYQLMNRLPIPEHELPVPNGYDDIIAATRLLPASPIVDAVNFNPETASLSKLKSATNELQPSMEALRNGLSKEVWQPLKFTLDDRNTDSILAFRTIALCLNASAVMADRANDPSHAAEIATELVNFGNCLTRGTTVSHAEIGIACANIGSSVLYQIRAKVPTDDCLRIVLALGNCETSLDSPENVLYRERVWTQHALGWTVHLGHILLRSTGETGDTYDIFGYSTMDHYHRSVIRLLQLEFALRAWKAEHYQWPESLEVLTPSFIPTVPLDPFSPDEKPLQYNRTDEGYVLYSVGRNEIDEGGQPPDDDDFGGWHGPSTGDLRLDIHFAPDPPQNAGAVNE